MAVYNISNWVEAIVLPTNDVKVVVKFIKTTSSPSLELQGAL